MALPFHPMTMSREIHSKGLDSESDVAKIQDESFLLQEKSSSIRNDGEVTTARAAHKLQPSPRASSKEIAWII
jgi:hypothetical protein